MTEHTRPRFEMHNIPSDRGGRIRAWVNINMTYHEGELISVTPRVACYETEYRYGRSWCLAGTTVVHDEEVDPDAQAVKKAFWLRLPGYKAELLRWCEQDGVVPSGARP